MKIGTKKRYAFLGMAFPFAEGGIACESLEILLSWVLPLDCQKSGPAARVETLSPQVVHGVQLPTKKDTERYMWIVGISWTLLGAAWMTRIQICLPSSWIADVDIGSVTTSKQRWRRRCGCRPLCSPLTVFTWATGLYNSTCFECFSWGSSGSSAWDGKTLWKLRNVEGDSEPRNRGAQSSQMQALPHYLFN